MTELALKILLWALPFLVLLALIRKPLSRLINEKTKEMTRLPPVYTSPEIKKSLERGNRGYTAPEVYTVPTFRIPELLGLLKDHSYPARGTALEYVGQYFSKDYAKRSREFEALAVNLMSDPAIRTPLLRVLGDYCRRFNKPGLLRKAEKRKSEAEGSERAEREREAEELARANAPENRPHQILLLLGNALNEGKRVEVRGSEIKNVEECIQVVFSAGVGEGVEVAIEEDGKMVRQNLVFRPV